MISSPVSSLLEGMWLEFVSPPAAPNNLRLGIDVVDISVLSRQMVGDLGKRFTATTFTPAEIVDCRGRAERFATRWAIKEAVAKAIGTGFRQGLRPKSIAVITAPSGAVSVEPAPDCHWPSNASNWAWAVSASHEAGVAAAIAVAVVANQDKGTTHA